MFKSPISTVITVITLVTQSKVDVRIDPLPWNDSMIDVYRSELRPDPGDRIQFDCKDIQYEFGDSTKVWTFEADSQGQWQRIR